MSAAGARAVAEDQQFALRFLMPMVARLDDGTDLVERARTLMRAAWRSKADDRQWTDDPGKSAAFFLGMAIGWVCELQFEEERRRVGAPGTARDYAGEASAPPPPAPLPIPEPGETVEDLLGRARAIERRFHLYAIAGNAAAKRRPLVLQLELPRTAHDPRGV